MGKAVVVSKEDRLARKERLERLMAEPAELLETIYAHVANGGSLIDLCNTWDVRFSDISRWLDADEARKKLYNDAQLARNEWVDEMLLKEVRAISHANLKNLYDESGNLKAVCDLDDETARLVQSVEVDELYERGEDGKKENVGQVKKVKLWDKLKAIEMGLKNRRLLVDKTESEVSVKLEDLVGRSMGLPAQAAMLPAPAPVATPSAEPAPSMGRQPSDSSTEEMPAKPEAVSPLPSDHLPAADVQPAPAGDVKPEP